MAEDLVKRSAKAAAKARRLHVENLRLRRLAMELSEDYGLRVGTVSLFVARSIVGFRRFDSNR
jgi:hypothetical protein